MLQSTRSARTLSILSRLKERMPETRIVSAPTEFVPGPEELDEEDMNDIKFNMAPGEGQPKQKKPLRKKPDPSESPESEY